MSQTTEFIGKPDEPAPPQARLDQQVVGLWAMAQAGNEHAYAQALTLMAGFLRRYFVKRLPQHSGANTHDAEDLVQETLLAVHIKRGTYDAHFPFGAWLYGIAHHKLVDWFRRHGRKESLNESFDELDEAFHPAASDAQSGSRDLQTLLAQLPQAQQRAIVLTKVEGFSLEETAAQTGASVAALKVQVHRGLKKLAELVRK